MFQNDAHIATMRQRFTVCSACICDDAWMHPAIAVCLNCINAWMAIESLPVRPTPSFVRSLCFMRVYCALASRRGS
eukprot:3772622-Amphidinium_carterae.1